ncbi:hypothetical protein MNBD_GAMMA11-3146 [hydrothermal vent metagenome]|uniref:ASPIC/UnbV domain-containing protein n=1 Tax=hydrothermal vent metagenome TaxID=652676 RepID=A0A3B0X3D0_9ZZZZ
MKHFPVNRSLQSQSLLKNKVFWLSILMLITIAATFWTQSRVPALNEKAQVGDRINISAIAFDVILPVTDSQPLYERVYKAAINWGYTNWKGMSFGFLLAAAFITLLQILPKIVSSKNRFLNSLLGLGMGSPLGVCVNCATPIAQGMIHGGARLETSLAMLISSPTLNPIVLTIAFSLLSFHVALIKVLITVFFIVLIVPVLVKFAGKFKNEKSAETIEEQVKNYTPEIDDSKYSTGLLPQTWSNAFSYTIVSFLKNLLYIIKITLPLMVIAGLLGSFLIEVLPDGSLSTLSMHPATLILIAAIGTFLPVPIAFDVLMVNVLISSGLDIGLASTLLFALGIFSIYPALIIARSVSIKLSFVFFVSVMIFAMVSGVITSYVDQHISHVAKVSIEKALKDQRVYMTLNDVMQTCNQFASSGGEMKCFQKMMLSDVFQAAGAGVCEPVSLKDEKQVVINKPLVDMCRQVFAFTKAKKAVVAQGDINVCKTLSVAALVDECMIGYIRADAMGYTSLEACQQIDNIGRQRYCRALVIGDRMKMKSTETCELGLSQDMYRQCIDNLNAHITSEFGELHRCDELLTENAINICRSTVISLKISKLQEYAVCETLITASEVSRCKDQVVMHRSVHDRNPSLCSGLTNSRMINDCRIGAVIRQKQVEIESKNLLAFNNATEFSGPGEAKLHSSTAVQMKTAAALSWSEIVNKDGVSVAYVPNFERNLQQGKIFKKLDGTEMGLNSVWTFDLTDFMEPFIYGKGIASGDYNNDGWPDLVFASSNGLMLYKNNGKSGFVLAAHITSENQALNAFVVSFVDIDNDGWQDLFLSAYGSDSYFFKNNRGQYSTEAFLQLPINRGIVALSAGFADWNKDGRLDVVTGNWSYGAEGAFIPEKSQNVWYKNEGMKFTPFYPDESPGETLSVLMSDINMDGNTDMVIGNDRKYPDMFYTGDSNGKFNRITDDMNIIRETSLNTMSYDSADFNNDLLLDVFSTDMAVAAGSNRYYCDSLGVASDKQRCEWLLKGNKAVESLDVGWCASLKGKWRSECYTAMAIRLAKRDKNNQLCNKVSSAFPAKAVFCNNIARKINDIDLSAYSNNLRQRESNKMLLNTKENKFIDATKSMGVKQSFWGWTGKAADLDNDGWQDLYIGNGIWFGQHSKDVHSNVFYHNQQGQKFVRAEKEFGLENYINTPSYTYVDFDLDGDIDIVSTGVMSTPSVFVNQGTKGNSISFDLRDNQANKFCIGCKIIIHYGGKSTDGAKSQIREIKLSGGFMSFDEPVAYFGIDKYSYINGIKVVWSTGEAWEMDMKLDANRRYRITRHEDADAPHNVSLTN